MLENLQHRLEKWDQRQLTRKRKVIVSGEYGENHIQFNNQSFLNFSSNDYLGLNKYPVIIKAFTKAVEKYGFGSGASGFISGYSDAHHELELQFAKWLQVDQAVLFNTGYVANIGVIDALTNRSQNVFSDKLCHASILDGIQLSRAKHYRYAHCNLNHLTQLIDNKKPDYIISESIFSMEGNIAPIPELVALSRLHNAGLIIDDAHGIGVLGDNGGGVAEQFNLNQTQFSCLMLPLGKAFNAIGAIVAGRNEILNTVLQFSKSYRTTTAMPAAVCAALQASLKVVIEEQWRREKLKKNIEYFIQYANEKNLNFSALAKTPIKSLIIGDNNKTLQLQKFLLSKGVYVPAILPPSVPNSAARLRISLNSSHTQKQLTDLLDMIANGHCKL